MHGADDMSLTLHQLPPGFGEPFSVSPFCAKLEAYFRLAGVDYEVGPPKLPSAPKKKVPFIRHEGGLLADSQLIIEWSKATHGDPLDGELTDAQRDTGLMVQRVVENHLYFVLVHSRWLDEAGWVHQKAQLREFVPAPANLFVPALIRRSLRKQLYQQGVARHSLEDLYRWGAADLGAVSRVLGEKPFLLGDSPTSFDCAAFGQISGVLATRSDNALTLAARGIDNLVAWERRMRDRLDWS